ncbi:hypothetical protein EXIGLDRAFT_782582 [Exidia glandulosa HHB12029]|uniref:Uncharacterized protein n=1 Tax=Exidia glandulosa HHB12029 TaxID=1314781 RepID=A0A166NKC6_EXIGL|nr:hypothetical protein EXIGLDRAFT_782582 [Exidia glandulosa HHB12029]
MQSKAKKSLTAMWFQPGGAGADNAGGAANATTTTSAAAETPTAADYLAAVYTGIKDVVEMCLNAHGKTRCFEILGARTRASPCPVPIATTSCYSSRRRTTLASSLRASLFERFVIVLTDFAFLVFLLTPSPPFPPPS